MLKVCGLRRVSAGEIPPQPVQGASLFLTRAGSVTNTSFVAIATAAMFFVAIATAAKHFVAIATAAMFFVAIATVAMFFAAIATAVTSLLL